MTLTQWLLIIVVALPLLAAAMGRVRVELAAWIIAAILGVAQYAGLGMLGPAGSPSHAMRAFDGLAQPVVVTLFGLFILTSALEKTGVTRWLAGRILALGGHSVPRLVALFTATTAVLSLFMNTVAAGALVLPSALDISRRTGIRPSKLLMPIAFGSLFGGMATYFTTANIIMSGLLASAQPPQRALTMLDFLPAGGLIALAGIAYMTIGHRLLPDREAGVRTMMAEDSTLTEGHRAPLAVAVTLMAVAASVVGFPSSLAMLAGALIIVLSGVLSLDEVYDEMEWGVLLLVAGMYVVSTALVETGLADLLSATILHVVAPLGPLGLAAGVFLLGAALAQLMGGQVTAFVTGPLAIQAALTMGADVQAIALAAAIGSSAVFLTPFAHPVNMLIVAPGNYRFTDFARVGAGALAVCFVVLLVGLVAFWGL
jgi:di/tricarboxylate transporter